MPADAGSGQALGIANLRFRPAEQEGADSLGFAICNILVMEVSRLLDAVICSSPDFPLAGVSLTHV